MLKFFAYLAIGKLLIFIGQKFPFHKLPIIGNLFAEGEFLEQLFACDLCLGFYVFSFLDFFFYVNIFAELKLPYVPILNEILVGTLATFLVHVFSIGWNSKFGVIVIE